VRPRYAPNQAARIHEAAWLGISYITLWPSRAFQHAEDAGAELPRRFANTSTARPAIIEQAGSLFFLHARVSLAGQLRAVRSAQPLDYVGLASPGRKMSDADEEEPTGWDYKQAAISVHGSV